MTTPKDQHEPDELDIDAEIVTDLEPDEQGADDVRGGGKYTSMIVCGCFVPK